MERDEIEAWWASLSIDTQQRLLVEVDVLDAELDPALVVEIATVLGVVTSTTWQGLVVDEMWRPHVTRADDQVWQLDRAVLKWLRKKAREIDVDE